MGRRNAKGGASSDWWVVQHLGVVLGFLILVAWGLAGRASEAVTVGGRCPNGAGELGRTHPDHTGDRGPPSEQACQSVAVFGHEPCSRVSACPPTAWTPHFSGLGPALPLALTSLWPHLAAGPGQGRRGSRGDSQGMPSRAAGRGLVRPWQGCGQQGPLCSPPPRLGEGLAGADCARGQGLLSGSVSPSISWEQERFQPPGHCDS